MTPDDITTYLARANGYAFGVIGGILPASAYDETLPEEGLRAAVGLAFEVMSTGESSAVDPMTGNLTQLGPNGFFVTKKPNPLDTVDKMLRPYKNKYDALNASAPENERGCRFL
jgi:hypothetical protein